MQALEEGSGPLGRESWDLRSQQGRGWVVWEVRGRKMGGGMGFRWVHLLGPRGEEGRV